MALGIITQMLKTYVSFELPLRLQGREQRLKSGNQYITMDYYEIMINSLLEKLGNMLAAARSCMFAEPWFNSCFRGLGNTHVLWPEILREVA